ncbi:MAG: hypothetical protein ACE5FN_12260 [Leptospirillia bacterium]
MKKSERRKRDRKTGLILLWSGLFIVAVTAIPGGLDTSAALVSSVSDTLINIPDMVRTLRS